MKHALCAALACCVASLGQDRDFGVDTRLVLIPVTVTSSGGRFVNGLDAADFRVLDNGRPASIRVDSLATGVAPIALVVAIQTSGISTAVVEKIRRIGSMFRPLMLGERGSIAVLSFDRDIRWLQSDWTSDEDKIVAVFAGVRGGGSGAVKESRLLDGAMAAIDRLRTRRSARRVLLLISETRDRSSKTDWNEVAFAAQQAGVVVYAAQYSAFRTGFTKKGPESAGPAPKDQSGRPNPEHGTPSGAPSRDKYDPRIPPPAQRVDILGALGELGRLGKEKATEILVQETGGMAFSFARQKGLEDAIAKIGEDLHAQYVLSFAPSPDAEPGYHKLEVRVVAAAAGDRGEVSVRARPGYWSR